jgi:hypothetical protein
MIKRAMDYVNIYKSLSIERKRALSFINDFLNSQKKEKELPSQEILEIKDIKIGDKSISFTFLDFAICIELSICTTKSIGFIRWLNINTDSEGKAGRHPILIDAFNNDGHIDGDISGGNYAFGDNFNLYLAKRLMVFCEKVDQAEFNEKAP